MIIKRIITKSLYLLAALALLGVGGCRHSDDPCPPQAEDPEVIDPDKLMLCLNVSFDTQNDATRAGEPDPDDYYSASGDFEKIRTMRVIIIRNMSADGKSGIVEANRLVMTNDDGHPINDNLEFKVIANEKKRIYIVANEDYLTAPEGFKNPANFLDSFKTRVSKDEPEVFSDLTALNDWTVSVPGLTPAMTQINGYAGGLFSPAPSRRLPLTEYFDIEVNRTDEVDDQFYSHLFITRAAAKAVFYLNTSGNFAVAEGEVIENTYIKAITLTGVGTTEYVFPNKTEYSIPKDKLIDYTTEDHPASLPSKKAYITTFATPAGNRDVTYLINDVDTEIKQPADGNPRAITSPIYFPESILAPDQHYKVGVQLSNNTWLYADLDNSITKRNILTIKDGDVVRDAIARNTFLRIELNFDGALNLTATVLPWNREDHYVEYTNNVGITDQHCLIFSGTPGQTGDYLYLDEEAAQLVLNYGKVAYASFTIDSPIGNTWDAYLITTGGSMDAIQFQIPDPADKTKTITTTHISGKIGEKAEFGIVSTVAPSDEQCSAQLIVMATLDTGTQVIVDVLKGWGSSNPGILTVIQNPI